MASSIEPHMILFAFLPTLIEGESLLNHGSAIEVFILFDFAIASGGS